MRSDDDELVPRTLAHRPPVRLLVAPPEPGAAPEPGALRALTRVVMEPGDTTGYIQLVARSAAHRGAGLGPLALAEAMRVLAGLGATRYGLSVVESNTPAIALYRRHGFAIDTEDVVWRRALR